MQHEVLIQAAGHVRCWARYSAPVFVGCRRRVLCACPFLRNRRRRYAKAARVVQQQVQQGVPETLSRDSSPPRSMAPTTAKDLRLL